MINDYHSDAMKLESPEDEDLVNGPLDDEDEESFDDDDDEGDDEEEDEEAEEEA